MASNDEQAVVGAIKRLLADGWRPTPDILHDQEIIGVEIFYKGGLPFLAIDTKISHWGGELMGVIFDPSFAKALWGEELDLTSQFDDYPNWQKHLMQMVIADDRIKYIGDNI